MEEERVEKGFRDRPVGLMEQNSYVFLSSLGSGVMELNDLFSSCGSGPGSR